MNDYKGEYGVSLAFPPGLRPDPCQLDACAQASGGFSISQHLGVGDCAGAITSSYLSESGGPVSVEALMWGLTFDVIGLAPGEGAPLPSCPYDFELPPGFDIAGHEAVRILPGPHLRGGERLVPIVRAMAGLTAALCSLPDLAAVVWHPARSRIAPAYFSAIVVNWLEGGVFPARGLVSLGEVADGAMQTEGVGYFTGQELRIEPELMGDPAAATRIAVRLIDHLVTNGSLDRTVDIAGPEGRLLRIEPSENGRLVRVWSAS
ncbi:MAG: hypothetical protein WCY92_07600 [Novosphingobium sp.]